MKFQIDHDMHIHSLISPCAGNDPRQTAEAILSYGVCSDLRLLCIAKAVGCKFYLGSDAHMPDETRGLIRTFRKHIDILGLTEEDKLPFVRENLAPLQP